MSIPGKLSINYFQVLIKKVLHSLLRIDKIKYIDIILYYMIFDRILSNAK